MCGFLSESGNARFCARWLLLVASALGAPCFPVTASATPTGQALSLPEAQRTARQARAEHKTSSARIDAARQRPAIVSALDDPIITPVIDHRPVDRMMRTDRSISIEQSFPLSRIRSHKRSAAEADNGRAEGEAREALLKIQADVAQAFFMLNERRRMAGIAGQLARMAAARHASGSSGQLDVLRLEADAAFVLWRRHQWRAQRALAGVGE